MSHNKSDPTLDFPFILIDFIMNLWVLQLFKLDDHTKENLQTCVYEINIKIKEWAKFRAVFIFIYNKVIESNCEYLNVDEKIKYAH